MDGDGNGSGVRYPWVVTVSVLLVRVGDLSSI